MGEIVGAAVTPSDAFTFLLSFICSPFFLLDGVVGCCSNVGYSTKNRNHDTYGTGNDRALETSRADHPSDIS